MSGQCYGCAENFGRFTKEFGCKNCGFSFCKKCYGKKAKIEKLNNEEHKVCNRCYNILTGKIKPKPSQPVDPPEAYLKRIAALENPDNNTRLTSGHGKSSSVNPTTKRNSKLSKEDAAIEERLQKLKDARKAAAGPIPSQSEIENRLAKLQDKGQASSEQAASSGPTKPTATVKPFNYGPTLPQQIQVDNLLDEICDEVEIDSHGMGSSVDPSLGISGMNANGSGNVRSLDKNSGLGENKNWDEVCQLIKEVTEELKIDEKMAVENIQKDKELTERLMKLKGTTSEGAESEKGTNAETDPEDIDENEATKRLIKQILEEIKLDERVASSGCQIEPNSTKRQTTSNQPQDLEPPNFKDMDVQSDEIDPDELPWCCICNSNASLRCQGCDNDLYCQRCYREGHDKFDMEDHQTVPYKPPKKAK